MGFDPVEGPRHFEHRARPDVFDVQTEQRHAFDEQLMSEDIRAEIAKLLEAELVVFQFPIWWFSMPAMLKGWLDRVFVLHYMGYTVLPHFATFGISASIRYAGISADASRLERYKADLRAHIAKIDQMTPLQFNGWQDWDALGQLKPDAPSFSPFMRHTF